MNIRLYSILFIMVLAAFIVGCLAGYAHRKDTHRCPPQTVVMKFDSVVEITKRYPVHDTLVIIQRTVIRPVLGDSVTMYESGSTCCWPLFQHPSQTKDTLIETKYIYTDGKSDSIHRTDN